MTYNQLETLIRENINGNGSGAITGPVLQDVLMAITNKIEEVENIPGPTGEDGVGIKSIVADDLPNNQGKKVTITLNDENQTKTQFTLRNGADGRDGRDGTDGRDGRDGTDGVDGRNGLDGRNGVDGADGRQGADGAQGPQGKAGPQGSQGPQGAAGRDGYGDQALFDSLERELDQFKAAVSGRLESISAYISTEAANAVADALNRLDLTSQSLQNLRDALNRAAQDAQNALNLARSLSGITGGDIDPETLNNILMSLNQVQSWINNVSGGVNYMLQDYDDVAGNLGLIGIGGVPSRGLLSLFGENINILSGTVGTVKGEWDASRGLIENAATWYSEARSGITSAFTQIDAMNGRISNIVADATASAVTQAGIIIDGRMGAIESSIQSLSGQDLTEVLERLSSVDASYALTLNRLTAVSGDLNTVRNSLNAASGELVTSITKMNFISGLAYDMRETWNEQSGMLKTVADLTVTKDAMGNDIFWYINDYQGETYDGTCEYGYLIDEEGNEYPINAPEGLGVLVPGNPVSVRIRAFYRGASADGRVFFSSYSSDTIDNGSSIITSLGPAGKIYFSNVYPDFMTGAFSYINQRTNSIDMAVSSGDIMSALRLEVTPDGSKINLTADRINLDGGVFARSFSAITANLGGIKMGRGVISAGTNGHQWALTEDGNLHAENGYFSGDVYANNGSFNGAITATSLTLGEGVNIHVTPETIGIDMSKYVGFNSAYTGNQGMVYISKQGLLQARNAIISGSVYAEDAYLSGKVVANEGYIGGIKIDQYGLSGKNVHITNNYFYSDNVDIKGSISANNGYFKGDVYANNGYFRGSVSADNGYFHGDIYANSLTLGSDAEESFNRLVSGAPVMTMLSGGCVRMYDELGNRIDDVEGDVETLSVDLKSLSGTVDTWGMIDMGDYVQLDHTIVSGNSAVTISKNGLLVAKNAVISGTVWATDGVFNGTVYANNGSFKGAVTATSGSFNGAVTATSLMLGSQSIDDYVNGMIPTTTDGMTSGDVKNVILSALSVNNWGVLQDLGDSLKMGTPYGDGHSSVTISKQGLLVAKNAIVSGTVFANNGVFNGTVYATDGVFKGSISATNGYFSESIKVGPDGPTIGEYVSEHMSASTVTCYRGEYDANTLYYGSPNRTDIVKMAGTSYYYRTKINATTNPFSGISLTNTNYWQEFEGQYDNVATSFLFANDAVIENAVVRKLDTNGIGERIVAQDNELKMYNEDGVPKLTITADNISLEAGQTQVSLRTSVAQSWSLNGTGGSSSITVTLTDAIDFSDASLTNKINFYYPAMNEVISFAELNQGRPQGLTQLSITSVRFMLKKVGGNQTVGISTTTGGTMPDNFTAYTQAGHVEVAISGQYQLVFSMNIEWQSSGSLSVKSTVNVSNFDYNGSAYIQSDTINSVTVGNNGMIIRLGGGFYASFDGTSNSKSIGLYGNRSGYGEVGIRLTQESGITFNNGSGWKYLN